MNKKLPLGIVLTILCLCILVTALLTGFGVRKNYNTLLAGLPEQAARYEILDELDSVLRAHYYGSSDRQAMQRAIAAGYISGLPDGLSRYLTAKELKTYQNESIGEMQGIGATWSRTKNARLLVEDVMDGSPAAQQDIRAGDLIVAVDGIPVDASNYDEMTQKLESDKLTSIELTVRSGTDERTLTLPMGFEAPSVVSENTQEIGYIKLTAFYATTPAQVKTVVDAFVQSGVKAIVLDLRKNNSEHMDYAMQTLDVFVPLSDTAAARLVNQAGETVESYMTDAAAVNLPLAVLVGDGTKAAAELFACDLRDFGKASLIGTETAGVGLVRKVFPLSNKDAVLLCVGEMLPYRSESFNGAGLVPDVRVEPETKTRKLSQDKQYLAAVNLLRGEQNGADAAQEDNA